MAHLRGTDVEKAHIGMDIFDPEPDFATLAKSMGMHGEGAITDPSEIAGASGERSRWSSQVNLRSLISLSLTDNDQQLDSGWVLDF